LRPTPMTVILANHLAGWHEFVDSKIDFFGFSDLNLV
jgi:hypothetical protein